MELLDKFVLPQSAEHIQLLHYMVIVVLALSIPFLSVMLCGTLISYLHKRKDNAVSKAHSERFALNVINIITVNKSIGFVLGVLPLFAVILIYLQLLHTSGSISLILLIISFIFIVTGIISAYTYKYSLNYSDIFNNLRDFSSGNNEISNELSGAQKGTSKLSFTSAKYAISCLFIGTYIYIAGITIAGTPEEWQLSSIFSMFSINIILRYLEFIAIAFSFTGAAFLFYFFVWDGGKEVEDAPYYLFVKETVVKITFVPALILPILVLLNLFILPKTSLSGSVFFYIAVAIILLLFVYVFLYSIIRDSNVKVSALLFIAMFFVTVSLIAKDQLAISNATQLHSVILNAKYDEYIKTIKGEEGTVEMSGAEVYQVRCSSCHKFDVKLVGPPYKQT
ncbi:MAG: hypothetical protein Q8903_11830, partial [Bacteroidota bacterium]|nr:hypothetical protein [Bacteroidota bacterium]